MLFNKLLVFTLSLILFTKKLNKIRRLLSIALPCRLPIVPYSLFLSVALFLLIRHFSSIIYYTDIFCLSQLF